MRRALWTIMFVALSAYGQEAARKPVSIPVPAGEYGLFEDFRGRIYLAATGGDKNGVFEVDAAGAVLKPLTTKPLKGAAVTFSGQLFMTRGNCVWRRDLANGRPEADVTAKFGGAPSGDGAVVVTGDERVWVRGCRRYRTTSGKYEDVPVSGDGKPAILPMARGIAGNDWGIGSVGGKRRMLVSPAQLRLPATSGPIVLPPDAVPAWQSQPAGHEFPAGDWRFVTADDRGSMWAATPDSLWVLHLEKRRYHKKGTPPPPPNEWAKVTDKGLQGVTITAMARCPIAGTLLGLADGRVLRIDSMDFSSWQSAQKPRGQVKITEVRPKGDGPVQCLWVDRRGGTWAVAGGKLVSVGEYQWQRWRRRPLFPWGMMGAGSCSYQDRLFVGGSLHGIYGIPASAHTGARHVMAARPDAAWARVCELRLARGFTGATEWRGRLWLMCGTSIAWHGCGSTDWVEHFNPKTGELDIGPRLYGWRAHATAVTWNDRLWVLGMGMKLSKYWGFMESLGEGEKKWRKEPEPPITFTRTTQGGIYDRVPVSACVVDDVFYLWTSQHGLLAYTPAVRTWRVDLAEAPEKPYQGHLVPVKGEVWFVGKSGLHAFSPKKNKWRKVAALPAGRQWGFAGKMGNRLVIGGGYGGPGRREILASQETFEFVLGREP